MPNSIVLGGNFEWGLNGMQFIVEFYTLTGLKQIMMKAASYREVEVLAKQETSSMDGLLDIRCIREIRLLENKQCEIA